MWFNLAVSALCALSIVWSTSVMRQVSVLTKQDPKLRPLNDFDHWVVGIALGGIPTAIPIFVLVIFR